MLKALIIAAAICLSAFHSVPVLAESLRVTQLRPDLSVGTPDGRSLPLYGIGVPGPGTPFNDEARKFAEKYVRPGAEISVDRPEGVSTVIVRTGNTSLNFMLIDNGLAWVNRSACKAAFCRRWLVAEHYAVKAKKGLWSIVDEEHPWQWR